MSKVTASAEHEFEAEYGLPETLPRDERLLWQGSPQWGSLAIRAFHLRKLAIYFGALLALRFAFDLADGETAVAAVASAGPLLALALFALGMIGFIAWLSARTAVYSITSKRVVMRIGVVLSVTFNLPFSRIETAAMRRHPDGGGDVTLGIAAGDRIAYLHLWPHARPWRLTRTEPMLRSVPDVERVAAILANAMAGATGGLAHLPDMQAAMARETQGVTGSGFAAAS